MKNHLSGVKTWSHILNFNIEAFSYSELKLTLRGLNNYNKHVPRSKLPLLPVCLMKILVIRCMFVVIYGNGLFWYVKGIKLDKPYSILFNPTEQLIR